MSANRTISAEYLGLQQELHRNPTYGLASLSFAPVVKELMARFDARSLSDYGAGKQNLLRGLNELGATGFAYFPYDPAFPEYGEPKPADLVCCIDVLEHIEPVFLEAVLAELRSITIKRGFFSVNTNPSMKFLADGRNAHLIQEPASWWLPRLRDHFEITELDEIASGFSVVAAPKSVGPR